MRNSELLSVVDQIGREKGIDRKKIIEAVESALTTAAKKRGGASDSIQVSINPETGDIEVISLKKIVEKVTNPRNEVSIEEAKKVDSGAEIGDEIGSLLGMEEFGRIAAQAAKQVIFQKMREAEWETVYKEYSIRQREIISGIILGQERRNYIVELGKTEALLPYQEQMPRESYRRGDRIKAYLLEVKPSAKGPQIILSRSRPEFVAKLFEIEVPEITEGIVQIKGVVREPGDRTKIAVHSQDPAVDPVGACVGVRGSRVQVIVRELRGEKIDIITWTPDIRTFIGEALSPAAIEKVGINEQEKSAVVVVSVQQYSLAIGKKGQNVRLAARLTGWKIDIISETEYQERSKEREREIQMAIAQEASALEQRSVKEEEGEKISLSDIPGVGEKMAEALAKSGFDSVEKVAHATEEQLEEIPLIGKKTARKFIEAAKNLIKGQDQSFAEEKDASF